MNCCGGAASSEHLLERLTAHGWGPDQCGRGPSATAASAARDSYGVLVAGATVVVVVTAPCTSAAGMYSSGYFFSSLRDPSGLYL